MCVAIIKPNGVELPRREVLQRCFMHNRHGGGLATLDKSRRRFKITKGFFDFEAYYKHLLANVSTDDVAFIHMRIATHGVNKAGKLYAVAEQCHPFPMTMSYFQMGKTSNTVGTVFMHNGMIDIETETYKGDDVSDTMTFNRMTMKCGLDPFKKESRRMLALASDPCRLAYMRVDKGQEEWVTVGTWEEHEDCLYSNDSYERALAPCVVLTANKKWVNCYGYSKVGNHYNEDFEHLEGDDLYLVSKGVCVYTNKPLKADNTSNCGKYSYDNLVKWLDKATTTELMLEGLSSSQAYDVVSSRQPMTTVIEKEVKK